MTQNDPASSHHSEVATSLKNAVKLGGSLIMTLVIGFGVRVALRRYLGPTVMGPINFADAFTSVAFVFLTLGVDMYARKVVPVHPEKASDFTGTLMAARGMLSLLTFGVMAVVLELMHQPPAVKHLVWAFAGYQIMFSISQTMVVYLQSARKVDGLSVMNVVSKLVWAAGYFATMLFDLPLYGVPLSFFFSEALRAAVSWWLCRKHLGLRFKVDWKHFVPVVKGSFAFYVNAVALVVVNRMDVNVLEIAADDTEIGLYSAASELARMTFMMTPMLPGVLMPLFSRTVARGADEFYQLVRRTLELLLVVTVPVSLAISVGSDVWVHLVYGTAYAAASPSLTVLGPSFLLTYISLIVSIALNINGGEWTVTVTSLISMVLNPILVVVLVALTRSMGVGGAGAGCALASIGTEAVVLGVMVYRMGASVFDSRLLKVFFKSIGVSVVVFFLDRLVLRPLGPARLLIDATVYVVLIAVTGAVAFRETLAFVKTLRKNRGPPSVVVTQAAPDA